MYNLGHHPYKPSQPNGWPDSEAEWLSLELLIRRLAMARRMAKDWIHREVLPRTVPKNFDNEVEVFDYLKKIRDTKTDFYSQPGVAHYLLSSEWMLKV